IPDDGGGTGFAVDGSLPLHVFGFAPVGGQVFRVRDALAGGAAELRPVVLPGGADSTKGQGHTDTAEQFSHRSPIRAGKTAESMAGRASPPYGILLCQRLRMLGACHLRSRSSRVSQNSCPLAPAASTPAFQ